MRVVPFDYRKAFDLSDHTLLVHKVYGLSFPRAVALWVVDFLTHRQQRVKLCRDFFYEWDPVTLWCVAWVAGVKRGRGRGNLGA